VQRRDLLILAGLYFAVCAFYFFSALAVTAPGYTLDDAWIHQVFARNLATGHGFSFNPDIPVSGATAPLWTLLMALLWPMTGPIANGILAGLILEFIALVAVYKLTILITGQRGSAFLVSLLSILTWVLIWGALSGMEIGLYSALSLWGLYFYFRASSFEDKYNYPAYAFFALAFLSRPECALFLAAVVIRDMIIWLRSDRRNVTPWLWRIAIPAIMLAPYFAFNYSVTGSLLTRTFAAKEQGRGLLSGIIQGDPKRIVRAILIYSYYHLLDFFWNLFYLIPLLLPAFVVGAVKFATVDDTYRSKRIMLVILLILYTALMGAFAPVLAASLHHMRMVDNLVPLFIMLGVAGLFWKTPSIGKPYLKILLWFAVILSLVGTIFIFADDFIVRTLNSYLLQNVSRFRNAVEYNKLTWYIR
jgi:Gpi18-like mannosyltransferase